MGGPILDTTRWNRVLAGLHAAGQHALHAGNLDAAEANFRRVLAEIEPSAAQHPELVDLLLRDLALVRRARGASGEAEALLRRILLGHEERHGHLAHAGAHILLLADVLRTAGEGREAADLYRRFVRDLGRWRYDNPYITSAARRRRARWRGRMTRDARLAAVLDDYAALLAEIGRPAAARHAAARAARLRVGMEARRRAHARAGPGQEAVDVDLSAIAEDVAERGEPVWIGAEEVRPSFRPGLRVVLFDEFMRVEGELESEHPQGRRWAARPDWTTLRALPPP